MENGQLIELLKSYPINMKVKIRHNPLIVGDIDQVITNSFVDDDAKEEEVIVLENLDLRKGKI